MFLGMILFLFLTQCIPEIEHSSSDSSSDSSNSHSLEMTGLVTALGISLHNFPEGLVVFNATVVGVCAVEPSSFFSLDYLLHCTGRGLVVAIAIAIHNIPEGIAVALPIYVSTKKYVR